MLYKSFLKMAQNLPIFPKVRKNLNEIKEKINRCEG